MSKIINNTTNADILIIDTGVLVPALGSYTIDAPTYLLWAESTDIVALITSGDITVSDGVSALSAADGLRFLQYADRPTIKENGVIKTRVVTEFDFTGSVNITDNGAGKATIQVSNTAATTPCLREVTLQLLGGTILVNTESNLLFEADPRNDTIKFFREETL